jgi:hypothetical protein
MGYYIIFFVPLLRWNTWRKEESEVAKSKNKSSGLVNAVKVLLVLFIILFIVLAVKIIFVMFGENSGVSQKLSKESSVKRNVVVMDNSASIPEYDADTVNTASNHDVKMNSTWIFKDGSSYSKDAYVENPSSNVNDIYFDITLVGMDQKLYTSPVLPVGSHLENIAFDKVLPAGTYNGILTYTLLGADGETSIGTLQMSIKIIIQS